MVCAAVNRGEITVPENCQACGTPNRKCSDGRRYLQAHHHEGYDKPLSVLWLCSKCHRKETPLPLGERAGAAKLTEELVRTAIFMHNEGFTFTQIGARLGVDRRTASRAINGVHWLSARLQAQEGRP